jgi:hypothetical protein
MLASGTKNVTYIDNISLTSLGIGSVAETTYYSSSESLAWQEGLDWPGMGFSSVPLEMTCRFICPP